MFFLAAFPSGKHLAESGFGLSPPLTYAWARKGVPQAWERSGRVNAVARLWGLVVAYLPRYSPHLNPVETVWRRVKGFFDAPAALRERRGAEEGGG